LVNTNKKLDSSAISLQAASDSIQGQASKLATIAEDTAKLQIVISDIENTVQTFQADLLTLGSAMNRFNELTRKFEISTESISGIQGSFDGNVNSLQSSINNSQSQIEQNSKDLMTSLTDLGKEISPISKQLSGLGKELNSLRKSIEIINKTPPAKK
jgi:chromosome segregation ATPase